MGIQDRDYYHEKRDGGNRKDTFYDPKRFREGRAPATIQPAKWSWQTMVKHTLIWIAIFLILMIIFNRYGPVRQQARSQPPAQSIGSGSLDLQQTRGGHYFSSGAVNGFPVVFMVDTGATTVSISSVIASRAGIHNCVPRTFLTANGNVNACMAIVPEVSFGGFRLTDIEVAIMPNMSGDALLGMNVLRKFHIEQIGEAMRISTQ